jgi:nitrate reductase delta subunit
MHISARELPDYLPLFLEFLSVLPLKAARSLLADAVHVVSALAEKLERRANPYAAVLRAVEALAVRPAQAHVVAKTVAALGGDADTLAALDRQWEEEAVRFVAAGGPEGSAGTAACGGV